MKFRTNESIISLIYILIFFSAVCKLRYTLYLNITWSHMYFYSVFLIIVATMLYFVFKKTIKLNNFKLLLLGIVVYELFVSLLNNSMEMPDIVIDVLTWPLIFLVFYDYSRYNEIPDYFEKITILGSALICGLSIPNINEHLISYGRNGGVVFSIYYCFAFLPMIYIVASKRVSIIFSIVVALLIMISTKRVGVIAVFAGIALYLLADAIIQNSLRRRLKRIGKYILLVLIGVIVGFYLIQRFNINTLERLTSIYDDEGSGRLIIWELVWTQYQNSPFIQQFFGHGFHAVLYEINPLGNNWYAHNSLLETLYDYGVVGLFAIIALIFTIVKNTIKLIKIKSKYAPAMSYTIAPLLVMALFSYFFEQSMIILPLCVVWGIIMGRSSMEHH